MDNVFKLYFQYNQKDYSAWVSLRQYGYDLSFFVHYNEQDLHRILPGGNLVFNLSQGLQQPVSLPDPSAEDLLHCTSEAIASYIQLQKDEA
jgi:hypothetical protein